MLKKIPQKIKRTPFGKLQIPLNLIPPLASDISPGMRKNEIGTVKQKIKKKKQSSEGCLPPRRKIKILTLEKIRKLEITGSSEKKKKEAPAQLCPAAGLTLKMKKNWQKAANCCQKNCYFNLTRGRWTSKQKICTKIVHKFWQMTAPGGIKPKPPNPTQQKPKQWVWPFLPVWNKCPICP